MSPETAWPDWPAPPGPWPPDAADIPLVASLLTVT
jgi:hypothetical protein